MENEIFENLIENTLTENTSYISEDVSSNITLQDIHNDLGFICSFLVIASVLIFMRIIYKLFNLFF